MENEARTNGDMLIQHMFPPGMTEEQAVGYLESLLTSMLKEPTATQFFAQALSMAHNGQMNDEQKRIFRAALVKVQAKKDSGALTQTVGALNNPAQLGNAGTAAGNTQPGGFYGTGAMGGLGGLGALGGAAGAGAGAGAAQLPGAAPGPSLGAPGEKMSPQQVLVLLQSKNQSLENQLAQPGLSDEDRQRLENDQAQLKQHIARFLQMLLQQRANQQQQQQQQQPAKSPEVSTNLSPPNVSAQVPPTTAQVESEIEQLRAHLGQLDAKLQVIRQVEMERTLDAKEMEQKTYIEAVREKIQLMLSERVQQLGGVAAAGTAAGAPSSDDNAGSQAAQAAGTSIPAIAQAIQQLRTRVATLDQYLQSADVGANREALQNERNDSLQRLNVLAKSLSLLSGTGGAAAAAAASSTASSSGTPTIPTSDESSSVQGTPQAKRAKKATAKKQLGADDSIMSAPGGDAESSSKVGYSGLGDPQSAARTLLGTGIDPAAVDSLAQSRGARPTLLSGFSAPPLVSTGLPTRFSGLQHDQKTADALAQINAPGRSRKDLLDNIGSLSAYGAAPSATQSAIVSRQNLSDLVRSISPDDVLTPEAEAFLIELVNDFVDSVTRASCQLARHRHSDIVEAKDLQFYLEHHLGLHIPGFGPEEYRIAPKRMPPGPGYASRLAAVRDAKK